MQNFVATKLYAAPELLDIDNNFDDINNEEGKF